MHAPPTTSSTSRRSPSRSRVVLAATVAAGLVAGLVPLSATSSAHATPGPGHATSHATRGAPAKSPKPLGPMLFIGDSVGASVRWSLTRQLTAGNYVHHIDARSGRCTYQTPGRCRRGDAWDALGNLPADTKFTFAVIELGYNDTRSALTAGIDRLMKDLLDRGIQRVLWVNLSERRRTSNGNSVYANYNDTLRAAAKKWDQLTILDWNEASGADRSTSWFVQGSAGRPDLIHLTSSGQKEFAQWLREELDRLRDAGRLPGSEKVEESSGGSDSGGSSDNDVDSDTPAKDRPELERGDSGAWVKELQKLLKAKGGKLRIDRDFGRVTDREVRKFQEANGLRVDGKVGPKTWAALLA